VKHVTTSSNVNISAVSYHLLLPNYAHFNFISSKTEFIDHSSKGKMVTIHP